LYTIRDIARLAQVSTATVSYVINGKGRVSEPLKRRVLEAMTALDYHPDQVARSLKVRHTCVLGVVIPDVSNPFFAEVMRGIEDEARKFGYSVIFCNTNEDPELERKHLETLFARRVDGVLLSSNLVRPEELHHAKRRFPMVFFDRTPPGFSGTAVVTDNFGASREAIGHLIELGHSRIAIISGSQDLSVANARLEGFRRALQEANLPLPNEFLKFGDFFKLENGYTHGCELMRLPSPPTAIFCCNNRLTLGLMRALCELGIPCPERVSVLAFDDFEWVASFRPHLTSVAQPTYLMGKLATEILIQRLRHDGNPDEKIEEKVVVLPNELRIRESTAPPFGLSLPVNIPGQSRGL
jgi:LacI family transcriptional regulator